MSELQQISNSYLDFYTECVRFYVCMIQPHIELNTCYVYWYKLNPFTYIGPISSIGIEQELWSKGWSKVSWFDPTVCHYFSSNTIRLLKGVRFQ